MNGRQQWMRWSFIALLCLLALAAIVRVIYALAPSALWWDETIYIGMAKHLFSGGTLGMWEMFRPPLLPLLLGGGWSLGIGIVAWGKALELGFSLGIIVLTYFVSERFRKGAGLLAAGIMAFIPLFFTQGGRILSDIPSAFFLLLGIYLIQREKWLWSGTALGLAFLMRFIHNLSVIGIAFAVIIAWATVKKPFSKRSWNPFLKTAMLLAAGFLIVAGPYFIITAVQYGDPLATLKEGSRVFTQYNNFVYDEGNLYYLTGLLRENPLLIFAFVGIAVFFLERRWREMSWNALLFPTALIATYLLIVVHKELRFFLAILPLLAILSGIGIMAAIDRLRAHGGKRWRWLREGRGMAIALFAIIFLSLLWSAWTIPTMLSGTSLPSQQQMFFEFFEDESAESKVLIATNPQFMVFTDKPVDFIGEWRYAFNVIERHGNQVSHVAVDDCEYPCEPGSACVGQREEFIVAMATHKNVFSASYVRWDGVTCNLNIWEY